MLSDNIRTLREAKGLSQEELAKRLNVVRQTVSKWERGLSVPDSQMLIRLAQVFGVTADVLLGSIGDQEDGDSARIAGLLADINAQLAKRNGHLAFFRKIALVVAAVIGGVWLSIMILNASACVAYSYTAGSAKTEQTYPQEIAEEAYAPVKGE